MIHCLHGSVGHFSNWDLLEESLGEDIVSHDLWQLFKKKTPSLAQAAHAINAQASQGDILLGYSMGGRVALHALINEPKKWRAAIIISAHPGLNEGHSERLAQDKQWSHLATSDWHEFLQKWNSQSILPKVTRGLELAPASDQSAVAKSFRHWSLAKQNDLRPLVPKITCPLLWITGEKDQKFTNLAQDCIPLLPNATHFTISNCGHRVPWEAPQAFTQTVQDFLAKVTIS